jgi:peroxiredoxin
MFPNSEGKHVPNVTFRIRQNNEWKSVSTDDIFKGRTVVVFSLPGAFTPTCSSTHLPRYNELAAAFRANGVDEIVCISVNDTFVMNEWAMASSPTAWACSWTSPTWASASARGATPCSSRTASW